MVGPTAFEFLDRRSDGTFFLRLFNADGSEAELSGNGTRCVAAWLAYSEIAFKEIVPGERWDSDVLVTHGEASEMLARFGEKKTAIFFLV